MTQGVYDRNGWKGNRTSFKRGEHRSPSTEFKKGEHQSVKTQFKTGIRNNPNFEFHKGITPCNKGKTGVYSEEVRKSISNSLRKENTPIKRAIRDHYKMKEWVYEVFERDKYTCRNCGSIGKRLDAHHIKTFVSIINNYNIKTLEQALSCKIIWNISNGRTLCRPCHKKEHGGRWN
jgi:hypothetical protein